jgi:hypothetical protein
LLAILFLVFSLAETKDSGTVEKGTVAESAEPAESGASAPAAADDARAETPGARAKVPGFRFARDLEQYELLLLLALLAGALGGSLHALQSFAAFVGNRTLRKSWLWWYLVRAPIGAILGLFFYVVLRAGLTGDRATGVDPYGVVAVGALAGLFSERATRKLREVFDVLFPSKEEYDDRLEEKPVRLELESVEPSPLKAAGGRVRLTIAGSGFSKKSVVRLGDTPLPTDFLSPQELEATFDLAAFDPAKRPAAGTKVRALVVDPGPPERQSNALELDVA